MNNNKEIIRYTWRRNVGMLCTSVGGIIIAVSLYFFPYQSPPANNLLTEWNNSISPVVGFATFLVALIVFWNENRQEWEDNLPKRLTVNFVKQDHKTRRNHLVLRCESAFLSSESEIRTWGQQIGSQMCRVQRLNFGPKIVVNKENLPVLDPGENRLVKKYEATFFLIELPEIDTDKKPKNWDEIANKNRTLLWQSPAFDDTIADYTVEVQDYSVRITTNGVAKSGEHSA